VRSVPFSDVLRNGSCAIGGREPCQAGNRAALSVLADVPRGCLFGAKVAVSACKYVSTLRRVALQLGLNERRCLYVL